MMNSKTKGAAVTLLVLALAAFTLVTSAHGQTTSARRGATAEGKRGAGNERTQGLMLGVHTIGAPGVTLTGDDFGNGYSTTFGAGAGLMVGYGFNRTFSSYVSFDVAKQKTAANEVIEGTYGLGHVEFGVRANLPLGVANTVPYVSGGVGRRALAAKVTDYESGESADVAFHGRMLGLGAGIEHFFSPKLSLDGGVQLAFGKFDHLTEDGEDSDLSANGTTSMRLRLGVTWRP